MKIKYIICLISILCLIEHGYGQKKIVILHTNDTHSRIEPLPVTDKNYPNRGGVVNRKSVIDSVRSIEKNVLLVDMGDFVQGTPYFNLFHGRVETGAMNIMKYDVGTLGNHEFDYGLDTMKMIIESLNFPIINCNYDFTNTPLKGLIKPYTILKKDGIKIGIIGVGCDPDGLIQKDKYEGMIFNPINETANYYADLLKNNKKCDIVICLTHIGLNSDKMLASSSQYIDLIIGGHSHTFLKAPVRVTNMNNKEIPIYQVGKNGVFIGKTEIYLDEIKK